VFTVIIYAKGSNDECLSMGASNDAYITMGASNNDRKQ